MPFCMPITCNRQIDSLDRRQQNLTAVPHDIERYRALEELLLSTNQIEEIPKNLFRLTKLRFLDLSDNDIKAIPSDISHLQNLVELRLRNNAISDIPEQLAQCRSLMVFDLSSNPITRLPEAISQCTSLTYLGLNDVSLTQLPVDIGNLVNLRSLEARENHIKAIPPSITDLSKLQMLDLGENEFESLPVNIGNMESLRELYIDMNDVETFPDQITRCRNLEQLDASDNKIGCLPEDFGALDKLTDLNLSENILQVLPGSIGRLRNLTILKLDKNNITSLCESIGNCENLTELFLSENLLTELPHTIGKLQRLSLLNLDKNDLTHLPAEIGNCASLTILSARENKLSEVPIEIGKCSELAILDLCNNRLNHLPFTVNVLFRLRAIWLSENQVQALMKLQVVRDSRTGNKVLTCYLLPQQGVCLESENDRKPLGGNGACVGGPKVHFPDQDSTVDEEKLPTGQFERHDTPKPKSHKDKLKKNSIDGHVIPHADQHIQGATLSLHKKGTPESSPQGPIPTPRSALKFQSVSPGQYEPESLRQSQTSLSALATASTSAPVPTPPSREMDRVSRASNAPEPTVKRIFIRRDEKGGLGLSIAGGLGSTPYKDEDHGLFVSKVVPGCSADIAGLKVGDKLLRVNSTDVTNVTHDIAVKAMQIAKVVVELTVLRNEDAVTTFTPAPKTPEHTLDISFMSEIADVSSLNKETISATLRRDGSGSVGFSVAGGVGSGRDGIFISAISKNGVADKHGKILVGDRVLTINGTKMNGVRHDQAVALLTGSPGEDVYLVVQRDRSVNSPTMQSTPLRSTSGHNSANTSMNQSFSPMPLPAMAKSPTTSVPVTQLGDTSSWDGRTEEVELRRDGKSLGLSIVGGSDHASHPFGVNDPGVFISKIAANSPADRCQRLRIGDRILAVNNHDVSKAEHKIAVEALQTAGPIVRIRVTHDPQPSGLKEVLLVRNGNNPLGLYIHGGVRGPAANPNDTSDEGIFMERVDPSSIAEKAGLTAGHRIIEVNGEPLLGCTQQDAADILKGQQELRLLICNGYNKQEPKSVSTPSIYSSGVDENGTSSPTVPISPINPDTNGIEEVEDVKSPTDSDNSVLSKASVIPQLKKVPPPVPPKPTLRISQTQNTSANGVASTTQPETLSFSNKLKRFEQEIEIKKLESLHSAVFEPPGNC
ncbi:unnamed protein product [Auanema sp. JU1783]|nr:unnamed protein product [Auanema sp. JU1783]